MFFSLTYLLAPIIILGGHSHVRDFSTYGPNTYAIQSGKFMESIGWMSVHRQNGKFSHRYLDFNLPTFNYHIKSGKFDSYQDLMNPLVNTDNPQSRGAKIQNLINSKMFDTNYSKIIGCAPQDYTVWGAQYNDSKSVFYLLTDNLSHVVKKNFSDNVYVIANTGSIRADIYQG